MKEFNSIITLAKIQDGADSAGYMIKSNVEQVFKKEIKESGEFFSPPILDLSLTQNGENVSLEHKEVVIRLAAVDTDVFQIDNEYLIRSEDNLSVSFKLDEYYNDLRRAVQPGDGEDDPAALDSEDEQAKIMQQIELLLKNVFFIYCSISHNGELVAERAIQSTYEVDSSLASFAVTANGINAAVGATKLEFNQSGLIINNGGLSINDKNGTALTFNDGTLSIKGHIEATSGSFEGELKAKAGKIAGLTLEENKLYYGDALAIGVDGEEAYLRADRLFIGDSGKIEGKLEVGGAILQNTLEFLQAGDISMFSNGTIKLGGSGRIYAENNNWSINGDGSADFQNIRANNVTLQNSVLEIGTVQSVGSLMLFKDSWEIEKIEPFGEQGEQFKVFLKVNQQAGHTLKKGDYFYCNKKLFEVSEVGEKNAFYINASIGQELGIGNIITKFGSFNPNSNDYIISIYGESPENNPFDFAEGSSLTISQGRLKDGEKVFDKRLILGDLSSKGDNLGVGLYADNVILNGSLVTKTDAQSGLSYAGINTKDGVLATIFSEKGIFDSDSSNIIFWAGSESEDAAHIRKAPFQVTQKGSIYAENIYLNNAVMAGGEIRGNEIYGAKIYGAEFHGYNKDEALKIYDDSKGIEFLRQNGSEAFEIFSINSEGLSLTKDDLNSYSFINFDSERRVSFNTLGLNNLQLTDEGLGIYQISGEEKLPKSLIRFNQNEIETLIDNLSVAKQTKENYTVQIPFYLTDTFSLGEKLSYKKVLLNNDEQGYDLYIS